MKIGVGCICLDVIQCSWTNWKDLLKSNSQVHVVWKLKCPWERCQCIEYAVKHVVQSHLFVRGFAECFIVEGQSSSWAAGAVNNQGTATSDIGLPNEELERDDDVQNPVAAADNIEEYAPLDFGEDNQEVESSYNPAATRTMIRSIIRGHVVMRINEEPGNEQPNEHAKIFLKLLNEA